MARNRRVGLRDCTRICAFLLAVLPAAPGRGADLLDSSRGAVLTRVDTQHDNGTWAGSHLTDNDDNTQWLSGTATNDLLYQLDGSGSRPAACFGAFRIWNAGSTRSIRTFTLLASDDLTLAKDTGTLGWKPVPAHPAPTGLVNHVHWSQGGRLTAVDGQHDTTTWAGTHLNDGSLRSQWLNGKNQNTLEYAFDTDWNGSTGDAVNLDEIRLHNHGGSRSVSRFQVLVTRNGTTWSRLAVPGTAAGDPDFNFLMAGEGALLTRVATQHDTTTWAGAHLHDGDDNSIWLSSAGNNELDFEFDTDFDGVAGSDGDVSDVFDIERVAVRNYGGMRSVRLFQIEVQTKAVPGWSKLEVPGSAAGTPGFNFLLDWEGANLTRVDRQHDGSTWAGRNLHDGDFNSRWLSDRANNELDFRFDVDHDGVDGMAGDADDLFTIESFKLFNYGGARSVQLFQLEVKTLSKATWTPLEVPGSSAGLANFNFLLLHEGASLTSIDAQHDATTWAARNLHDGDLASRWLSSKQNNSLVFAFDTDGNGATGDAINFYRIRLYNYGGSRSIQTFAIDVQTGSSTWTPVTAPGGGTTFTATAATDPQDYGVGPVSGVTAVRLRTLSNHGDTYTAASELELLGDSVRAGHTFTAQQSTGGETFTLDADDRPAQVTAVRFRSIRNYGDQYTAASELEIHGPSVGPSHTFVAAQDANGESFLLDAGDRPSNVQAVRFRSVQNYGDQYTGMRELRLLGPATRHRFTFEPGQAVGPHVYTLDPEDRVDGVVGARFRTLNNHGDTYVAAAELELLGDPVGPSFIFSPSQTSTVQSFTFPATAGRLFRLRALDNYGDSYVAAREIELEPGSQCSGGLGHLVIDHDGSGTQCSPETIGVSVVDALGSPETAYDRTIVLNTQTGAGTWTSQAGNHGVFSDSTPGDGLALYTFAASDLGTARFSVTNLAGASSVDLDAYQSDDPALRDDDSEGALQFAPSGFTVTASALPNPPPDPISDPIRTQTAGSTFPLHLTAHGTAPADPQCGVVESYTGDKQVGFWIEHGDPGVAPLVATIDGLPIATSEAGAKGQTVRFDQGQAVVTARYRDVGRIAIHAIDASASSSVRGSSGDFVSRPADLAIVEVANAAGLPNPGVGTATGSLFARAGEPFQVRVEARTSDGQRTPSYGRESVSEGIRLRSSTLVAPAGGRNGSADDGAIANAEIFAATAPDGTFTGSTFAFDEVGAVRLRASVADGDYLGTGDVTGSESGVVGRFAPSRFELTANTPRFRTACATGAFTWMGEPFQFASGEEPRLDVRAVNAAGGTTTNYAGSWWRLTNGSLAQRAYSIGGAALDASALPPSTSDPAIHSNGDGTGTLTYSSGSGLAVARDRLVAPFDAEIQLATHVLDEDGTAYAQNPFVFGGTGAGKGIAFDVSKRFQAGRLRLDNAYGSELAALPMHLRAQRFDGTAFDDDDSDSCSRVPASALVPVPSPTGLATSAAVGHEPLFSGDAGLTWSAPLDPGFVDVRVDLGTAGANLPWLRSDWPEDGNLDGTLDDDPRARATFGIWEGRDALIFVQELY